MAGIWNGLQMPMYLNTCSTAGGYVSEDHGTWLVKMSQQGHWPCSGLALCFLLWPPYDKQQPETSIMEPPHCDGLQPQPKRGYPFWLHQILRVTRSSWSWTLVLRNEVDTVTNLTLQLVHLQNWLVGGMVGASEAEGYRRPRVLSKSLMNQSGGTLEDQNTDGITDDVILVHSDEEPGCLSLRSWPENLRELYFKNNSLIILTEGIWRQGFRILSASIIVKMREKDKL